MRRRRRGVKSCRRRQRRRSKKNASGESKKKNSLLPPRRPRCRRRRRLRLLPRHRARPGPGRPWEPFVKETRTEREKEKKRKEETVKKKTSELFFLSLSQSFFSCSLLVGVVSDSHIQKPLENTSSLCSFESRRPPLFFVLQLLLFSLAHVLCVDGFPLARERFREKKTRSFFLVVSQEVLDDRIIKVPCPLRRRWCPRASPPGRPAREAPCPAPQGLLLEGLCDRGERQGEYRRERETFCGNEMREREADVRARAEDSSPMLTSKKK